MLSEPPCRREIEGERTGERESASRAADQWREPRGLPATPIGRAATTIGHVTPHGRISILGLRSGGIFKFSAVGAGPFSFTDHASVCSAVAVQSCMHSERRANKAALPMNG